MAGEASEETDHPRGAPWQPAREARCSWSPAGAWWTCSPLTGEVPASHAHLLGL